MKKSLFLTFCFSFIPGAGQMYQAFMKRGVSIMSIFAIFTGITAVLGSPIFAIPLPIIFAYSFFDTYNIRNSIIIGKELHDEYVWKNSDFESIFGNLDKYKKNKFIGIILIVIGIYLIFNSIIMPITYRLNLNFIYNTLSMISNYIPSILISVISIIIGVKFISKK